MVSGVDSTSTRSPMLLRSLCTVLGLASAAVRTSHALPLTAASSTASKPITRRPALRARLMAWNRASAGGWAGFGGRGVLCFGIGSLLCSLDAGQLRGQRLIYFGGDGLFKAALQRLFLLRLGKAGGVGAEVGPAPRLFAHRVDADGPVGAAHHTDQLLFGAAGLAADALA